MVLPSNASPDVYGDNATSHFKIQLPDRVDLTGRWQVALLEIQYPNSFFNVLEGENWIKVVEDTRTEKGKDIVLKKIIKTSWGEEERKASYYKEVTTLNLTPGYYPTADILFDATEDALKKFIFIDEEGKLVFNRLIREDSKGFLHVFFAPTLALQLGLSTTGPIRTKKELAGIRVADTNLGIPSQMYVYLDIVEEQIVGHTRAPLLRSLPTNLDGQFGTTTTYCFDTPVYRDLQTKSFDTLEVNIRTNTGKFMPFHHGTCSLLCHFRQKE